MFFIAFCAPDDPERGDEWGRVQLARSPAPALDLSEGQTVALAVVTATVADVRGSASGCGIAGLALGRQRHGRLQRADRDGLFQIFAPQQKFLLVGQSPASALVKNDFLKKRVASIPPKRLFRAFLVHGVAQLVEMG